MRNYFQISNEDHDPRLYLYADKIWVENDKIFIRVAHNSIPDPDLGFEKENQENIYSIDIHEFDAFNIWFQSIGTSDVYREIEEDDDFIPIDKWITDGLDKWKNIFKNDKEIIKALNKLKEPFGLIYTLPPNKRYFKEKIMNVKRAIGDNFLVAVPLRDNDIKIFLQENKINFIPDPYKFLKKLKERFL